MLSFWKNEDSQETGVNVSILHTSLQVAQRRSLPHKNIRRATWSPEKNFLCLMDKHCNLILLEMRIELEAVDLQYKPLFPKSDKLDRFERLKAEVANRRASNSVLDEEASPTPVASYEGPQQYNAKAFFRVQQELPNEKGWHRADLVDLQWPHLDQLFLCFRSTLAGFVRPRPKVKKHENLARQKRLASLGLIDPPKPTPEPVFQLSLEANLSGVCQCDSPVTAFARLEPDALVLGFQDGSMRLLACNPMSPVSLERAPRLLLSFNAHCAPPAGPHAQRLGATWNGTAREGVVALCALRWKSLRGGAHVGEVVSLGGENRVAHWAFVATAGMARVGPQSGAHDYFGALSGGKVLEEDEQEEAQEGEGGGRGTQGAMEAGAQVKESLLGAHALQQEPLNTSMYGDFLNQRTFLRAPVLFETAGAAPDAKGVSGGTATARVPRRMLSVGYGGMLALFELLSPQVRSQLSRAPRLLTLGPTPLQLLADSDLPDSGVDLQEVRWGIYATHKTMSCIVQFVLSLTCQYQNQ
jgi:hypothetical protein